MYTMFTSMNENKEWKCERIKNKKQQKTTVNIQVSTVNSGNVMWKTFSDYIHLLFWSLIFYITLNFQCFIVSLLVLLLLLIFFSFLCLIILAIISFFLSFYIFTLLLSIQRPTESKNNFKNISKCSVIDKT